MLPVLYVSTGGSRQQFGLINGAFAALKRVKTAEIQPLTTRPIPLP